MIASLTSPRHLLIVDDEVPLAAAIATRFRRDGHHCRVTHSIADARAALRDAPEGQPDLVLLDMRLPDGLGLELLQEISGWSEPPAVLVMTAFGDIDNAVQAMRRGASDYLRKPLDLDDLAHAAERVWAAQARDAQLSYARERDHHYIELPLLLGDSQPICSIRREIAAIGAIPEDEQAPANILILGETGTGKDVAARLLHLSGARAQRPFVRIDCGALLPDRAETSLLGRAGPPAEIGLIEIAEHGTVLLDEVCELPMAAQSQLLHVLERRQLRRLTGTREHVVKAQFVATSNRDPEHAIAAGQLRADLYFRLKGLTLTMPSLCDCGGDAVLLARHFIAETARRFARPVPRLSTAASRILAAYNWPGNVRELKHMIERAVLLADEASIQPSHLPLQPDVADCVISPSSSWPEPISLPAAERELMAGALARAGGNVSAAARELGISRMAMRYRMNKHGLK